MQPGRLKAFNFQKWIGENEHLLGLVVEPNRQPAELDAFEWCCFECSALVHRIEVKVTHLVRDLPPLYEAFFNDENARRCKQCRTIHPGKTPRPGWALLSKISF